MKKNRKRHKALKKRANQQAGGGRAVRKVTHEHAAEEGIHAREAPQRQMLVKGYEHKQERTTKRTDPSRMMETLVLICGGIATMLAIIVSILQYQQHHRDVALWLACGICIVVVIGGFAQFQKRLWEGDAQKKDETKATTDAKLNEAKSGFITPGTLPTPDDIRVKDDEFAVLVGDDCLSFHNEFPYDIIIQQGEPMLTVLKDGNNFWLNAKVFSADGRIVAEIVKNEFTINHKNCFRIERRDPHRLVVYDEEAKEVINLEFLNKNCARLKGAYYLRKGASIYMGNGFKFRKGQTNSGDMNLHGVSFRGIRV